MDQTQHCIVYIISTCVRFDQIQYNQYILKLAFNSLRFILEWNVFGVMSLPCKINYFCDIPLFSIYMYVFVFSLLHFWKCVNSSSLTLNNQIAPMSIIRNVSLSIDIFNTIMHAPLFCTLYQNYACVISSAKQCMSYQGCKPLTILSFDQTSSLMILMFRKWQKF